MTFAQNTAPISYSAPKLTVFGAMADLTAGGASGLVEGSFAMGNGCGPNTDRMCN